MKQGYICNIAADSEYKGNRLTTFRLRYPRMIHCFDRETEILGQFGDECPKFMKFFKAKYLGAKVAQYNPETQEISFVDPDNFFVQTGKHKMINFDKKKFSMSVTDEHRVFTLKRTTMNNFVPNTILAKDLLKNYGTIRIPQAGISNNEQFYSNDELALIVWFVSDGYRHGNKAKFHFRKQRKVNRVIELLEALKICYRSEEYEKDIVISFDVPHWVNDCYNEYNEKVIPDLATKMTMNGYESFKMALLESDGNVDNREINTTSKTLAEQIQVIALLHNDAMNIRCYGDYLYKQKFQETNYISLRSDKDIFEIDLVDHDCVYCVSVPSSYIVVRRKGIAYISGNCELMTHRMFSRNRS